MSSITSHVCKGFDFHTLFEMRFGPKKEKICRDCYHRTAGSVREKIFEYEIHMDQINKKAEKAFKTLKLDSFDKKLTEYTFDDYIQIGKTVMMMHNESNQHDDGLQTEAHEAFVFGQEKKNFKFCFPYESESINTTEDFEEEEGASHETSADDLNYNNNSNLITSTNNQDRKKSIDDSINIYNMYKHLSKFLYRIIL